jgi:hypothetical protein
MFTYLFDPVLNSGVESPVPLVQSTVHLALTVLVSALGFRWAFIPARESTLSGLTLRRRLPAMGALGIGAAVLFLGARGLGLADRRTLGVSHSDGLSWALNVVRGTPFDVARKVEPRTALVTPAGKVGQVFLSREYPLVRGTPHAACKAGYSLASCAEDRDGDGYPLAEDCEDGNPRVHPGNAPDDDTTVDGLDQDCSGIDGSAPNILVLELEGLPARVLPETHGEPGIAPRLSALARRPDSVLFTNYETAATQTAPGFVSAVCSLYPNFGPQVTRAYPKLSVRCLPAILAELGYQSVMVQNGDTGFDSQGAFARHMGFQSVEGMQEIAQHTHSSRRLSSWGLLDSLLFKRLEQLLRARRAHDPPLFLVAQTINNHHPYRVPAEFEGRFGPGDEAWSKVRATSAFVDQALGDFIAAVDQLMAEQARPLLVVLAGDHGHPSGQHLGNVLPSSRLYRENVHTPLIFWSPGSPDRLLRFGRSVRDDPASSVDLLPTLLSLLGAQKVHASMGRDLLAPQTAADLRAISTNPMAGGLIRIARPGFSLIAQASPFNYEWFERSDLAEQKDLASYHWKRAEAEIRPALEAIFAARALITTNRLWPTSGLPEPSGEAELR